MKRLVITALMLTTAPVALAQETESRDTIVIYGRALDLVGEA